MRMFLIGDMHLGMGFPTNYDRWNLIAKNYVNSFLLPYLEENIKEGDIIIQLGDLFDNRNTAPIGSLNFAQDFLLKLTKLAPTYVLVGNHDMWNINTRDIYTTKVFKYIPNLHLIDEPINLIINGHNLGFLPYIHNKSEQVEAIKTLKEEKIEYLFCHSDLDGAKMHLNSIGHKNFDKVNISEFDGIKHVYSGHIHILQENKNFTFVGSSYPMDRNDYGNKKGIFIVEAKSGKSKFVENNVSPIFDKIYILKEEDIVKFEKISNDNFNDLYISNTLISDKKINRVISSYLNSGIKTELVEYVDDSVVEEAIIENVSTDDIITLNFNYVDKIKETISSNSYNENFDKAQLLVKFNEVNDIYCDMKRDGTKIK